MKDILDRLGLAETNPGTWLGSTALEDDSAELIESFNPATGELIASVRATTPAEYEQLIEKAREAYAQWRKIPAPARGEAIRKVGNALRENKDALGSLVSLEMGKIKAEGDGEV
ncbi:MAG: aldehyde dehydrogenase family protein, partial [Gammaproteobacteria bacterium]